MVKGGQDKKQKISRASARILVGQLKQVVSQDEDALPPTEIDKIVDEAFNVMPMYFVRKLGKNKQKSKNWGKCKSLLSHFLSYSHKLLKQLKSQDRLVFVFSQLEICIKLLDCYPIYCKNLCYDAVRNWGSGEKRLKLVCYQFIRKVCLGSQIDKLEVFKKMLSNFTKNAKFVTWESFVSLDLMRQCFSDILGISMSDAYSTIFVALRQISITLGTVLKQPQQDSFKQLFNWQVVNKLILICQCLIQYKKDLKILVYPFTQICLGILKNGNQLKYYPLRLHILRLLTSIQSSFENYIPGITPVLLEMIKNQGILKRTASKKFQKFEFQIAIKASKEQYNSSAFKELLVDEIIQCFVEHLGSLSNQPSFPEIILPVQLTLKKYCKQIKNPQIRGKILQLIKILQENSQYIETNRDKGSLLENNSLLVRKRTEIAQERRDYLQGKVSNLI